MANTTWSTTDKSASITLSGSNLVATTGGTFQGVRGVDLQTSGKYYFEITLTTGGSFQAISGLANRNASLTGVGSTPTGGVGVLGNTGNIFLNGSSTGISFGVRASGDIIGFAVDLDNKLIWCRIAPSGNWNNNAGFAPGGTGGVSLTSITNALIGLTPLWGNAGAAPGAVTANFGDTAFSGAVPGGYTSGWPTPGVSLAAGVTQLAIEEWAPGSPQAQLTQVAVEEWATVSSVTVQAVLTQVAVEEWTVIPSAATTAPIVVVMA